VVCTEQASLPPSDSVVFLTFCGRGVSSFLIPVRFFLIAAGRFSMCRLCAPAHALFVWSQARLGVLAGAVCFLFEAFFVCCGSSNASGIDLRGVSPVAAFGSLQRRLYFLCFFHWEGGVEDSAMALTP